jgi:adenylate cyclase
MTALTGGRCRAHLGRIPIPRKRKSRVEADLRSLLGELKRRRVFRVALAYAVVAFGVLQGADVLTEALALPGWTLTLVAVLVILGFPVAVVLAWAFDVTPEGVRRAGPPVSAVPLRLGAAAVLVLATLAGGGWWLSSGRVPVPLADAGSATSIAVLPFVNMSADAENEYFSDGISEELLNLFAKVPGLQVAARTSSFAFKGRDEDITEIGRQLRVAHVLEGSVRKSGGRVRITAQLIESGTGYHLWSETYDRDVSDIFAVQDEIARAIVAALAPHLGVRAMAVVPRNAGTANARAHDLYLLGLREWHRRGDEPLQQALERFSEAARLDPSYAAAHAGMALTHAVLPMYGDHPVDVSLRAGRAAALRALELQPEMPEAYAALGQLAQNWEWDWLTAERHYARALELNPNYATAHLWRCELLAITGKADESIRACQRGVALDPLSPVAYSQMGSAFMVAGQQDSARTGFERSVELAPDLWLPRSNLALSHVIAGDPDGWLRTLLEVTSAEDAAQLRVVHAGWSNPRDRVARAAAVAAVESMRRASGMQLLAAVPLFKALGESGAALDAMTEASQLPQLRSYLPWFTNSVFFADDTSDPRFLAVQRAMNLAGPGGI